MKYQIVFCKTSLPFGNPLLFFIMTIWLTTGCNRQTEPPPDPLQWVDPFIGTGFHGHVFLGASVPFGAVQLGPVNLSEGWDWCSGYHYSDSTIIGFSHTHLSGTGIGDLGDFLVMPVLGTVKPVKGVLDNYQSGYYSKFSHAEELCRPGYYAVQLPRYGVYAELTASTRVGFHQYRFPETDSAQLILDLKEGIGWDKVTRSGIRQINDSTVEGFRYSTGWAKEQQLYFTAVFSKPLAGLTVWEDTLIQAGNTLEGIKVKGIARFTTRNQEKIKMKLGISAISCSNAAENIQQEIPGWDFEQQVSLAASSWRQELSKIAIEADHTVLRNFYTALYHTMIAPAVFDDHNGDYRGSDGRKHNNAGKTNYTILSLWDTYRAANPLFTIIHPERVDDLMNTLLQCYQQQGRLPVWSLVGNETNTMPGNSAIHLVTDAYLKGFRGFDTALAWEAVRNTAMQDGRGLNFVKQLGFIPADSMVESVAMGLEYAIADAGIACMAKQMGLADAAAYFERRGNYYKNYYDSVRGFMRGRIDADRWRHPFSPFEAKHMKDDFCEGNAWQYTWLVPQDVNGLITLLGGRESFLQKLDSLFQLENDLGNDASADITGLIGQYAHGNEPSHHIPYLYSYAGRPDKTAEQVRYILDTLYHDTPAGLCGNEDAGQLSAWYILSALGFYQVDPSNGVFVFGSPRVAAAKISLPNGRSIHLLAKNNSSENIYIQRACWQGKPYDKPYISYQSLMEGGVLLLEMGPRPAVNWGNAQEKLVIP